MKTNLLKAICLIALTITSLPILANDYLKIYFKDGHTERHYMKLVESISATKYDLEGNLHSDYQMQQIVMADTTYSYYIADIDSMSFTKVYEEQLKKDVKSVSNNVTQIFNQCATIEEMEEHIDEIKSFEGVEDVRRSGTDIIVKVRDWYDIIFMYPVVPDDESSSLVRNTNSIDAQNIKRQVQQLKKDGTSIKVAIAFQMVNDTREGFIDQGNALRRLAEEFNDIGIEAVFIPSEKGGNLDLDFYSKRMFDYDIVILLTHGGYNEETGVHRFLTDEFLGVSTIDIKFWNWVDENLDKYGLYGIDPLVTDIDDAFIGTCRTGYTTSGAFIGVYEKFIGKNSSGFGEGTHIVFVGACHSLDGKETLIRANDGTEFKGNKSVAEIFFNKGADIYMGYIGKVKYSGKAAHDLFHFMLQGDSQKAAFNHLDDGFKYEKTGYEASLIDIVNEDSEINPKSFFLFKTHTLEKTEQEVLNEYSKNKTIEVVGTTTSLDPMFITMGFEYSYNNDFSESKKIIENVLYKKITEPIENGNVRFWSDLTDFKLGDTIYYRSFTFDGIHYNWGEERTFIIKPADLKLSASSSILNEGELDAITIISGNGSYEVKSSDDKVATATIDGEKVIIVANGGGPATVTVTDTETGKTATIEVSVTPSVRVSSGYLTLEVGWSQTVDIITGSGSYIIETSDDGVATVSIYDNTISINALKAGPATITVTDTKTGQTATIQVEVTQKADSEVETFTVNGVSFDMVKVKGGAFTMGATQEQDGAADTNEKPTHQVVLPTYYMGRYEVTQELWKAVTGKNPATQKGEQLPVGRVSWDDCQQFVSKLNELTGQKFRLPTEAEWEYAARGGSKSNGNKYAGGDEIENVAWHNTNSSNATHDVGQKSPNELGLYDMSGNVWEWCEDWYGSYGSETLLNPVGPSSGSERVARGGSYAVGENDCRVSSRGHSAPSKKNGTYGMRLALPVEGALFDLTVSDSGPISLNVNESVTVKITSGNGNYKIDNKYKSIVSAKLNENIITITALKVGPATITVTDTQSGQKVTIEVEVKEKPGVIAYTACPDSNHPHWIDLGLPSGTKWSCCNEGASAPEQFGIYYGWGEVSTAPNQVQAEELKNHTTFNWATLNGVNGGMFTGRNGGSIFIPAAGVYEYGNYKYVGEEVSLWVSSSSAIWSFGFNSEIVLVWTGNYYSGVRGIYQTVRSVAK